MEKNTNSKWIWHGHAGHLILSNRCRFHLTTEIGPWLISTVGDFYPNENSTEPETVGVDRLYETMVFAIKGRCSCGCGIPLHHPDYMELDFIGYNTAPDARMGHLKMCEKWAEIDWEVGTQNQEI